MTGSITDTSLAPSSPSRQALTARPSTTSSWSPVGSSTSASSPTKAGPEDEAPAPAQPVPVAVRPSTTEAAGADTAAAIAAAIAEQQPLDRPDGSSSPGVFRRVGKWAGKLVSKNNKRRGSGGDDGDDIDDGVGDGGVGDGREDRAAGVRHVSGERGFGEAGEQEGAEGGTGRREDRGLETTEGERGRGRAAGFRTGEVDSSGGAARTSSSGTAAGGAGADSIPAGEGDDFSLVFPVAAPSSLVASGGADEDSRFLPASVDDGGGSVGGGGNGGGSGRGLGGVDFGNGGAVVVFQLLMQRWRLRPWVVVPRTLVATKEQVRAVLQYSVFGVENRRERGARPFCDVEACSPKYRKRGSLL